MNTMTDEKRKKTRVHFGTQVIVKSDTSEIVADTNSKNISVKGLLVETDEKIPVGTPCEIEILLTGTSSKLSLNIQGKIVRQTESGLAIAFDAVDVDSYFHLKNLVMHNAEDPDAVEKEILSLD